MPHENTDERDRRKGDRRQDADPKYAGPERREEDRRTDGAGAVSPKST